MSKIDLSQLPSKKIDLSQLPSKKKNPNFVGAKNPPANYSPYEQAGPGFVEGLIHGVKSIGRGTIGAAKEIVNIPLSLNEMGAIPFVPPPIYGKRENRPDFLKAISMPTSPEEQAGALAVDVAGTAFGMGQLGKIPAITSSPKITSLMTNLSNKSPKIAKAINTLPGMLKFVSQSAASTAVPTITQRSELPTASELKTGLAIDVATLGLGQALKKTISPFLWNAFIKTDVPTGNIQKLDDTIQSAIGKYYGTKRMIVGQADDVIKGSSNQMDDLLTPVIKTYKRADLASKIDDVADGYKKSNPDMYKTIIKFKNNWIKDGADNLSAIDLKNVKQDIAGQVSTIFDAGRTADPSVEAKKQALLAIWSKIDDSLDVLSPKISKLNKQMTTAYAIKGPLAKSITNNAPVSMGSFLNPRNLPLATTAGSLSSAGVKGIGSALSQKALPPTIKGILERYKQYQTK